MQTGPVRRAPTGRRARLAACVAAALALAGCRQDMHDQAKIEPYEESDFFADGVGGARIPPAHTLPRGTNWDDVAFTSGYHPDGTMVAELPLELTPELLDRGEERYNIFCSPCHARTGAGNGMIVERGFAQPPSYHEQRLREMPLGYFFDVASNGYGLMSGYKAQIKAADRWAIAAWIRVLQRSRNAPIDVLSPEERQQVIAAGASAARPADEPARQAASGDENENQDDGRAAAGREVGAL
ncbi:MAG: cytochrome c [Acidobacteria bacterium]|nr:MAG: cytochrome c [Acidobacteriota bacterium]REK04632.1 MAG: cytochrome c [Acidobacteriota bacterium]